MLRRMRRPRLEASRHRRALHRRSAAGSYTAAMSSFSSAEAPSAPLAPDTRSLLHLPRAAISGCVRACIERDTRGTRLSDEQLEDLQQHLREALAEHEEIKGNMAGTDRALAERLVRSHVSISLSIHERTRELGLLRAVGMTRRQLAESVVWESVIIALAGTVIGLAIGVVLGTIFVDGIDQQGVEPVVSTVTVAVIGVLGATAGVFLAIRPALRATRVNVLAAISSV